MQSAGSASVVGLAAGLLFGSMWAGSSSAAVFERLPVRDLQPVGQVERAAVAGELRADARELERFASDEQLPPVREFTDTPRFPKVGVPLVPYPFKIDGGH
jgi:hypothetical protein